MPVKPPMPPGSDMDLRGCIASAGYTWCEVLGRCVRSWETACQYPKDCLTWYDGCNTCQLIKGVLGACTRMYCMETDVVPYCMVPAPEASIMPLPYDPLPPVINPFLGGH